ncbi:MAG: c-type cytochrome [Beijerinckiaceae bacterium]
MRAVLLAALLTATPALAMGDRALGEYLAAECVTCHQLSGRVVGGVPSIVGQPEANLLTLMKAYRAKELPNNVMQTIAAKFSDEEIAALAAFFSSVKKK